MKIVNDSSLISYIESLIETNNINMSISDMMSEIIGNTTLFNKNEISALMKKFNLSDKEVINSKISDYFDIDLSNEEDEEIFTKLISNNISKINPESYFNNPYYKNIKISSIKEDDYELVNDKYQAYELFPYKDMSVSNSYKEINSFAYFDKEFPFLAINKNKITWMSITPNEIETMSKSLEEIKGKVIVCGLGLGYYPYMASLKDDVKEIIIIEKDKKVISLFEKYLLPQFVHKEKIKIINKDAFEYLKETASFDYCFIDLWHDPYDGVELYLKSKSLEKEGKKYHYWLESSFYALFRRCFISLLEEQLAKAKEDSYKNEKSVTDRIINKYYYKTKNLVIDNESILRDLLSDKSLLNLLK